jgi:hypothetical protein
MEAPSPRYILTRAAALITLLVVVLFAFSYVKKYQRRNAIVADLQSITSDSSFFQQFYEADARKSLIRAIGLIAEANTLGMSPDKAIDRGMGIEAKFFENEMEEYDIPAREKIIRASLRGNYENFLKLGYQADFHTIAAMKNGELPPLPSGPQMGRKAEIGHLISPTISPGMEKVIANLEIRPPLSEDEKPTVIQIAAAKQLARDLSDARIIEEPIRDQIIAELSKTAP